MPFTYPLMLDVSGRLAVIVGGGGVAVRKARGLLDAGVGGVRVVSPAFHPEMPDGVERVTAAYEPKHLDGAGLAFAATNVSAVNDQVVRDCAARGILVNRADVDDAAPGDFATPAQLKRGPVVVTVSAGSPALAATVRDGLAGRWDERWTRMAEAMRELRPMIVQDPSLPPARRAELFRWLATEEALDVLAGGGIEELRRRLAVRG
ncbi:MAG TPA: NAD(P)-dependent oxidoreductase [Humisphaera sp.]